MNKEIEKRIHEFAEQMYNAGCADTGLAYADILEQNRKKAYENGLNDAWECARKITLSACDGGIAIESFKEVFGATYYNVIKDCSPSEAIAKIKEYEEKQKSINPTQYCRILKDNCAYPEKQCYACALNYQYRLAKHKIIQMNEGSKNG